MTSGPRAIGIIMDGNRRWARENGLPSLEGHRRGAQKTEELLEWIAGTDIQEVTLYAFSTENWNRTEEEITYLMNLFREAFSALLKKTKEKHIRMRFIGQRDRLPEDLQAFMTRIEQETTEGTAGTLIIALSYGGRAEILSAVNELLTTGREQVTEAELRDAMWSSGLDDPDLIIRTGGDMRLSNFLTWQSAYSELFFTKTPWPDFTKQEFDSIIADFGSRERRKGK